ncbi:MAG: tetratricopeptide repeat protein [Betaproteobacteria bacterium]|nr:MAG: tetratricopeptide repeat protein [Betaproteobacteria bacterium]
MLIRLIRQLLRRGAAHESRQTQPLPPSDRSGRDRAREALHQAVALLRVGRLEPAETLLQEALGLEHDLAEAHFQMGVLHERRGELEDAADSHELAVHFDPRCIPAHYALAALHKSQGRHMQAAEHYVKIVELSPEDAAAHTNLCLAFYETADYDRARRHGERAIEIDPKLPEAHHNLGLVLREVGEPAQAVQHFQRALDLKPRAEMAAGLAHAYRDLGRLNEAIASYDRALRLKTDLGDAVINRAYAYLMKEDYGAGWAEYEGRFAATGTKVRDFGLPRWNGEPLRGKSILVHAEQGLGDEVMFASCLPDLIGQAERVIVECSDRLEPLFRRSFPQAIVQGGKKEGPADWVEQYVPVHWQLPIGSLPRWFRADRAVFPMKGGYLKADPQQIDEWRGRLDARNRRVIGLAWRGGGPKTRGHLRSVPIELLAPLLDQDAVFVSLQHGAEAHDLERAGGRIKTFPRATENLDHLAALIAALDLVVSVDNTTVQLAGALGHPVWVLLSASPEWRYGLSSETMPWYPSAKLFRQGDDRRWEPVISEVIAAFPAWMEHSREGVHKC